MNKDDFGRLVLIREMYFAYHGGVLAFDGAGRSQIKGPSYLCFSAASSLGVGSFIWPPFSTFEEVAEAYARLVSVPDADRDLLVAEISPNLAESRGTLSRLRGSLEPFATSRGNFWYHSVEDTLSEYQTRYSLLTLDTGRLIERPKFVVCFPPLPLLFATKNPARGRERLVAGLIPAFARYLHVTGAEDGSGEDWLVAKHAPEVVILNSGTGAGIHAKCSGRHGNILVEINECEYPRLWEPAGEDIQTSLF